MSKACKDCGTVGRTVSSTPGSVLIELILWLCFLVPGLIYSFWRLSRRHEVCGACGSRYIVPIDTPVGRQIASQSGTTVRQSSTAYRVGRNIGRMFSAK